MNLNLLRSFAAIYQCGTLTDAGRQLGLSQPALSHALKQLREEFNDDLFVRDGAVYRPTRKATELAPPIIDALSALRKTVETAAEFEPASANMTLRLSVSDYSSRTILPALIKEMRKVAPGIQLVVSQISYDTIQEQLQLGEVDLAIIARPSSRRGPNEQVLLEERVVCLARKDHPKIGKSLTLQTFTSVGHVIVNLFGKPQSWVDDKLTELGLSRQVKLVVPYFDALPEIVSNSDLIGSLPARLAEKSNGDKSLSIHPLPVDLEPIRFCMCWHPRRHADPAIRWFRALLSDTCTTL